MLFKQHLKYSLFIFILLCGYLSAFGQVNKQQQVDQLNQKASQFSYLPDSLLVYAKKAHQLAIESNYKNGEAVALRYLGQFEHMRSNFDLAQKMYKESLGMLEGGKNNLEIAKTCLSIAFIYNALNDFGNSLNYGLRALKIFDELKDIKGQGKILNLLGIASANQGDLKRAKTYFIKYNAIAKKEPDTVNLAYSYNNLGGVNRDLKLTDTALYYYKIAARLFTVKNYLPGLALADRNIGGIYFDKKDYKNSLLYAKKSLQTSITSKDPRLEAVALKEIGVCYRELKDTATAYIFLKKAVKLATAINEKVVLRDAHACLAELEDANKNYKAAYENLKASRVAHDSLLNTEKTKVVQELTTKYETEKKEKEIKSLSQESVIHKLELKQRNIFLIITLSLLIIGAIFSYLFYNRRKLKEEARLQAEINKQQEQTTKAVLSAEENERIRIASDLHDGVGQILSTALMNFNGLVAGYHYADENEREKTQNVLSLINESYDEMRAISHQMMPNALIKAGLTAAVKDFIQKIDKDKLKISLETIGLNSRLDHQVESVLYRIIQETVNNVIKHANATKLNIQFLKDEDGVAITIEDNGQGFDVALLQKSEGIGLKNMISRIAYLKGTIDFDTAPGKGTLVAIHIPN